MEFAVATGLMGLGSYLNKNGKAERDKQNIHSVSKHNKPSTDNIYQSNYSRKIIDKERKMVRKNNMQSSEPIKNNIIPRNFNQQIVNDQTNPIKFLERPHNTRKYNQRENNEESNTYHSQLSGVSMPVSDFKHNNMVPFFGSQVRQNVDEFANQSVLENFTGVNTHEIKKTETSPLFSPEKDMNYVNGTPVQSSDITDRYIASRMRTNELPIEKIKVGPGLNQGFSAKPHGGLNQDSREFVMPKTTDELRVATNPKLSYKGRVLPGKKISKPGMEGKVSKNRPDTFAVHGPERYFTTTGASKGQKQRSKVVDRKTNRQCTTKEYTGAAAPAQRQKPTKRGEYKKSNKVVYGDGGPRNAVKSGGWTPSDTSGDYGKSGVHIPHTEREDTEDKTVLSNLVSTVKAMIAPVQDIFRTSKKENFIGNVRQTGNLNTAAPKKMTIYDPNDVARTTIKETNIHNDRSGNMAGPIKLAVYDPDDVMRTTIKETNVHDNRTGNMKGASKIQVHNPDSVARTTIKETNIHDNRTGNMKRGGTGQLPAYDPNDITRTTIKETNIHDNRTGNINKGITQLPAYDPNDITRTTIKETNIHDNRTGNINKGVTQLPAYDPNDITRTTIKETNIHDNRSGNINKGANQLPVYDPNDITRTTIKETNIHDNRTGNINKGVTQLPAYDPNDITRTTIKETNIHDNRTGNINKGVTQLPAYDPNDITRTTIKETNIHDNRTGNINKGTNKLPAYDPNDITRTTIKETNIHDNRTGNINKGTNQLPAYDPNDITRTTIKETNIHDNRTGNMKKGGAGKLPVYDPDDITRTTIKETNIHDNRTGHMGTQPSGRECGSKIKSIVYDPNDIAKTTVRETLDKEETDLNLQKQGPKNLPVYDPNDIARTTIKETNIHDVRTGNVSRTDLVKEGYSSNPKQAPNTNRQFTSDNEYVGVPDGETGKGGGKGYLTNKFEAPNTNKQFTSDNEYSGIAGAQEDGKPMSYEDIYNASLNNIREPVSRGRKPTQTSAKVAAGEDKINMDIRKLESDRVNQRDLNRSKIYNAIPQAEICGITKDKQLLDNEVIDDRINPDIVSTFKDNPYTQSLNSY